MFEIIELLQGALENPWTLLFLAVWGIGFFVKEYTPSCEQTDYNCIGIRGE